MFLRLVRATVSEGVKREYVRVVEAYRDDNGKTRHRTIVNLGRRDLLATHLDLDKLGRLLHGAVRTDRAVRSEDVAAVGAWDRGPGRRGQVNAFFGLTVSNPFFRRLVEVILWDLAIREGPMEAFSPKPRLRVLLDHLAAIKDSRQSWKVAYPLREVLFLVVCGTIASGDDYDDIVDWGEAHLSFLRGFSEFYHGIPCADWLRTVMNRIDPDLFAACFSSWVAECWPDKPDLVAIDGKTSRRSHDRKRGQKALHLVSAFATTSQLVLGQEAVDEKSNEITAIPALLERIDLTDALVSIDAMGCNPNIAQSILDAKADYLLAVKDNQPTLHADIKSYFETAPSSEVERFQTLGKDHGRLEMRAHTVSHVVDWITSERSYPGAPRFPNSPPSPWSKATSREETRSRPNGDPTSPRARSRPKPSLAPCEATGPSRTTFTGPSTSLSMRTSHGCERVMAPRIWPSSATSPSIWFAKPRINDLSRDAGNAPVVTPNTCSRSCSRFAVNLDSLPWIGPELGGPSALERAWSRSCAGAARRARTR